MMARINLNAEMASVQEYILGLWCNNLHDTVVYHEPTSSWNG